MMRVGSDDGYVMRVVMGDEGGWVCDEGGEGG